LEHSLATANRDPNKQEDGFILHEAAQNFELLRSKNKNKKPIAVFVLSDSYKSYLFITDDVIGADDTVPIQFAGNLLTSLRDVLKHIKNKIKTHGSIYSTLKTKAQLRD
jgi:hypothetical protein